MDLADAFRHNAWATAELLRFCRQLSPEQLRAPGEGTYGSVLATLNHLVRSDVAYIPHRELIPDWRHDPGDAELDVLEARAAESAALWEAFLSEPFDPEQTLLVDAGAFGVRAGILPAQALHHGNSHREQVNMLLTRMGFEPPELQAWEYAVATGRGWDITT